MQYVPSANSSTERGANAHVVQMIDKLWFQWQLRDSSNTNAFAGGSVSAQVDPSQAATYPTGSAPFLDVRGAVVYLSR